MRAEAWFQGMANVCCDCEQGTGWEASIVLESYYYIKRQIERHECIRILRNNALNVIVSNAHATER